MSKGGERGWTAWEALKSFGLDFTIEGPEWVDTEPEIVRTFMDKLIEGGW